jgi:SAM-dependent methyltransferase
MGEIFRRETAQNPEPFTGERLTTAIGGQVQVEHYHRYLFARAFARGVDVLDVASGEGYGSALLAQVARSVIGVEYSAPTVRSASTNFPRENLHFLQGDARALPLGNDCIDLVVSFETIEHFDRQGEFLREIRRVLRPDGMFIVSTPDRDVYSPLGSAANPYHVQELTQHEFAALLRASFPHVTMVQQRPLIGSVLLADSGSTAAPLVFDRRGDTHFEACNGLPRAPYIVAIASGRELPPLPTSLYIDRSDLDTDGIRLAELNARLGNLTAQVVELDQTRTALDQTRAELGQTRSDNAHLQDELASARSQLAQSQSELQQMKERAMLAEQSYENATREGAALQRQLDHLRGSFRGFMRGYLPRVYRHLRGRSNYSSVGNIGDTRGLEE